MRIIDADKFENELEYLTLTIPAPKDKELKEKVAELVQGIADEIMDAIYKTLDEQPTVNEWIPCSERLPLKEIVKEKEERGSGAVYPCLIRIKRNKTRFPNFACFVEQDGKAYFCKDHLEKLDDVIAWMPLPETYKGDADK